jgi:hypothetical protein
VKKGFLACFGLEKRVVMSRTGARFRDFGHQRVAISYASARVFVRGSCSLH